MDSESKYNANGKIINVHLPEAESALAAKGGKCLYRASRWRPVPSGSRIVRSTDWRKSIALEKEESQVELKTGREWEKTASNRV